MIKDRVDYNVDELTGAKNRRFLVNFIPVEIKKAERYRTSFSIILFDVDNFKEINDMYGHLEGDKVLKELAQFVQSNLRESDTLIRYGGDEFVIFLPNTHFESAKQVAEKILTGLKTAKIAGRSVSISIGIAEYPTHGTTWSELFSKADVALYRAKRRGKGVVAWVEDVEAVPIIPTSTFIDRLEERRELLNIFNREFKGILVRGGAGIGKTRLIRDTFKKLDDIFFIQGVSFGAIAEIPFGPIKELAKHLEMNYRIETKEVLSLLSETEREVVKSLFPDAKYNTELLKDLDKFKLYDAFLNFLNLISERKKVVLFIDDIQWADKSSVDLLFYVVRNAPLQVRFIFSMREGESTKEYIDDFIRQLSRERLVKILELKPFNFSSSSEFINAILQEDVSEGVLKFLYQKSGGNPFFIEELIKDLYEKGHLVMENRRWVLKNEEFITVPESIQQVMKNRVQEFENDKVLEVAACVGHEFSPFVIEGVLEIGIGEIYDSIDKAIKKGILEEEGQDFFVFKEDIMRELILSKISQSKKRFYHQRIAQWVEDNKGQVLNAEEIISKHAYLAQDVEKVVQYAPRVARKAFSQFAYEEAKKFWKYYFEVEKNRENYIKNLPEYVECLKIKGDLVEAEEFLKRVELEFKDLLNSEFFYVVADVLMESGKYQEALDYLDKAIASFDLKEVEQQEREIEVKLSKGEKVDKEIPLYKYYIEKGWCLIKLGKYEDARVILHQVELKLEYLNDYWKGTLFNVLGVLNLEISSPEEAISYFEKAIEVRERIGDKKGLAASYLDMAIAYSDLGDLDMTLHYYEKAMEVYKEIGYKSGLITTYLDMGVYYFAKRQYENAMQEFQLAYKESYQIGSKDTLALATNNIGSVLRLKYKFKEAEVFYKRALEIAEETGSEDLKLIVYRNLMLTYTKLRDYEMALDMFEKAYEICKGRTLDSSSVVFCLYAMDALMEMGKLEKVKEIYEYIAPHMESGKFKSSYDWYTGISALYFARLGDRKRAGKYIGKLYASQKSKLKKDKTALVDYYESLLWFFAYTCRKEAVKKTLQKLEKLYRELDLREDLEILPLVVEDLESVSKHLCP